MAFFQDRNAAVRDAIYAGVVEHGVAPAPGEVALGTGLDAAEVERIYQALADEHVIVLQPGMLAVAWAPPFAVLPTPFRATSGGASWFAPCAWDAFGIPAALKKDASIEARCAWSGDALTCGVSGGRAYGDAVIHLLVPAAHFWDDIFFT
jgi:Alkylmercury lyase